jgi:hypothetical protein
MRVQKINIPRAPTATLSPIKLDLKVWVTSGGYGGGVGGGGVGGGGE